MLGKLSIRENTGNESDAGHEAAAQPVEVQILDWPSQPSGSADDTDGDQTHEPVLVYVKVVHPHSDPSSWKDASCQPGTGVLPNALFAREMSRARGRKSEGKVCILRTSDRTSERKSGPISDTDPVLCRMKK